MREPPSTITRTTVRQYSPVTVLAVRAAAAIPTGPLAWVVARRWPVPAPPDSISWWP
jgi:hypothetical protein